MNSVDEAYQPSTELVRYHIASALTHLLTQAPVQGKAALQRLMAEVASPLFPPDIAGAVRVLNGGPLQRPKEVLVRDFVIATIKATLRGQLADDEPFVGRALTAVAAVTQLHPAITNQVFANDLPRVLRGLDDDDVWRILRLGVSLPATWAHMPDSVRTKLERLVEVVNIGERPEVFLAALGTPVLQSVVGGRVADLEWQDVTALFQRDATAASTSAPLMDQAVNLLVSSGSWNTSNALIAGALLPNASVITAAQLERIASAAVDNVEVEHANGTPGLLWAIREAGSIPIARFLDVLFRFPLAPRFSRVMQDVPDAELHGAMGNAEQLAPGDRVRHPTLGEGNVTAVGRVGVEDSVTVDFGEQWVASRTLVRSRTRLDVA